MSTIRTNLFSKQANDILDAVMGQLSDGWGENSPSLDKWWIFQTVKRDVTGEVIIEISDEPYHIQRGYYGNNRSRFIDNGWFKLKTEAERKAQIATWIKKTIYMEIADNRGSNDKAKYWRRDNNSFCSQYLNRSDTITVQDIYIVVEMLLGKLKESNYTPEAIARVVGKPLSAEATAAEDIKRKELAALDAEFNAQREVAKKQLEADKAELQKAYDDKQTELRNAYTAARAPLVAATNL